MRPEQFSRRDFHKLSAAAFGGLIAGTSSGCSSKSSNPSPKTDIPESKTATKETEAAKKSPTETSKADTGKSATKETAVVATAVALHACRGLNECKGLGKDKKNQCAGQGNCYTVTHTCATENECKYQGGCGGEHGVNACKGKGGCGHFPISEKGGAWKKARENFESRMKLAGKTVGKAPEPAKAES